MTHPKSGIFEVKGCAERAASAGRASLGSKANTQARYPASRSWYVKLVRVPERGHRKDVATMHRSVSFKVFVIKLNWLDG